MVQAPYTLEQAEEDVGTLRGQMAYLGEIGSGLNFGIIGTSGATFATSTANTASFVTIASASYPANNADAGACYELMVNGTCGWGSTQQGLTWQIQFGGNNMASVGITANAFPASQSVRWWLTARVYCETTSATGTWSSELNGIMSCNATSLNGSFNTTGATLPFTASDASSPTTIDTTSAQTLNVQAQWASTTGTPSLTSRVTVFRRIA